jgi:hypothetical protein
MKRNLTYAAAALVVLNVAGTVVAAAGDLGGSLLNGSKTSIPAPVFLIEVGGALALAHARGIKARIAGGFALLASTVSLAAVAFDGDLGHQGLTGGQVAMQVLIAAATLALWASVGAALIDSSARGRRKRPFHRVSRVLR